MTNSIIKKIIGSPGCGKTTYLMDRIGELLDRDVEPHEIGFFTFSVQGIEEAIDRLNQRFKLIKKDVPYFRTLHSLAFKLLGLSIAQIYNHTYQYKFTKATGLKLSFGGTNDLDGFLTPDDKMMAVIDYARAVQIPIEEAFKIKEKHDTSGITLRKTLQIAKSYEQFKYAYYIKDYTDMIIDCIDNKDIFYPDLKYIFIDEAQDLSKLQWSFVNKILSNCTNLEGVYLAGDDKQAINTFSGADVEYFIGIEAELIVLEQSYRVPRNVQMYASKIINKVKNKIDVEWLPRNAAGKVYKTTSFSKHIIDESKGDWLILTRNKSALDKYKLACMSNRQLFTLLKKPPFDLDVFQAIHLLMTEADIPAILRSGWSDSKQYKKKLILKKFIPTRYSDSLIPKEIGKRNWLTSFTMLSMTERAYIKWIMDKYDNPSNAFTNVNIRLSTIHGSKGTEATNVILENSMSNIVYESFKDDKDAEYRLLFTGITRAKENLYIVNDEDAKHYYEIL